MPERQCENWLTTLAQYVEETESPREFWMWAGLSAIAGALQRKVWLPFGLKYDTVYPNLYIMIVAPPGECRKGAPCAFVKDILSSVRVRVYADSPTKRAFTSFLATLPAKQQFTYLDRNGQQKRQGHSSITLVSKELSSFLAPDGKNMIEILTDLYDPHEEWDYETHGQGKDKLFGVCTNCFFASTPSWIASNLPEEAIGGGFTSRFLLVAGVKKYKWVSPFEIQPDNSLYKRLVADLLAIRNLAGEFSIEPAAQRYWFKWYKSTEDLTGRNRDPRLRYFIARMPTIALKTAMCLRVAYSDTLSLDVNDVGRAIDLVMSVYSNASHALGGQGRSRSSVETDQVLQQIQMFSNRRPVSFTELLQMNFRNTNKKELEEILETIVAMGYVKVSYDDKHRPHYTWVGAGDGAVGSGGRKRPLSVRTSNELSGQGGDSCS